MGDAGLPVADSIADALFLNPALFGKFKEAHLDIDEGLYLNAQLLANGGTSIYQVPSLSSYVSTLQANPRTFQGFGNQFDVSFATRGFGFSILSNTQLAAQADVNGAIKYKSLYQLIPAVGGGVRLADGIIRLGYSLQWVNQAVGTVTTSTGASPLGYDQNLLQGAGFSSTFGFALTLPFAGLPAFNAVTRNAFTTTYSGSPILFPSVGSSAGAAPSDPMTIDTSLSFAPKIATGTTLNLSFVYRDVTGKTPMAFLGRLALGAEIAALDSFFLRAGIGDGYPSAGLGIKTKVGELSFSIYSEEIGAGYLDQRDIHYLFQYRVRAF